MQPQTKRRWLLGGLIASLCLNLFLLGGIFGGHFGAPWGGPPRGHGIIMSTVPPELKSVIRDRFKEMGEGSRAERDAMKQEMAAKRQQVADALAAEPFDSTRLEAELAELGVSATAMLERAHHRIAEIAAGLTPEQRKLWADGWRKMKR
ncbi:putative membrane protein [Dongia mobilis]|uniref:Putative membrane protein n=1 Tax=Dongia mobilis TaxID=578943 RepID=A0A4R6WYL7_9PROT|nr:periplasmic heavy metal sensor [Dongia mobilis]TDQ84543.1 putative membrane protein [Dongia mobilis]